MVEAHYKDKKVVILGAGITGVSYINLFKDFGTTVYIFDDNKDKTRQVAKDNSINLFSEENMKNMDFLFCSPGISTVHNPHPLIILARKNNVKIISDLALFLEQNNSFTIAITGTNGKSTITSLVYHILSQMELDVDMGGNIGIPINKMRAGAKYNVLELSSYQLEKVEKPNFDIALLSNITPDHLDYHGKMENYIDAKEKIFFSKLVIANAEDEVAKKVSQKYDNVVYYSNKSVLTKGFSLLDNTVYCDGILVGEFTDIKLIGEHNRENIIGALALTAQVIPDKIKNIIRAIEAFTGLPHRIEKVGELKNMLFINDSKATNPSSTATALACFENIILIAGGMPKSSGFEELTQFFPKIKKVYLIGQATDLFARQLNDKLEFEKSFTLEKAVQQAASYAQGNSDTNFVVLLSPLCASFDQYKNFEERGRHFKDLVNKVIESANIST